MGKTSGCLSLPLSALRSDARFIGLPTIFLQECNPMRKLLDLAHDLYYRRYLPCRLPTGHERIYFYHIRKTGGTSFNNMILTSFDDHGRSPEQLWSSLWAAHRHRMLVGGRVFVAGERKLIESGKYF